MRIDDTNLTGIRPSGAGASQQIHPADQRDVGPAKTSSPSSGGDEVQLSSVAGSMSAGRLSGDQSVSAEHSAKIEHLTKLVESGQYNPDPEKIADSMIGDMLSSSGSS